MNKNLIIAKQLLIIAQELAREGEADADWKSKLKRGIRDVALPLTTLVAPMTVPKDAHALPKKQLEEVFKDSNVVPRGELPQLYKDIETRLRRYDYAGIKGMSLLEYADFNMQKAAEEARRDIADRGVIAHDDHYAYLAKSIKESMSKSSIPWLFTVYTSELVDDSTKQSYMKNEVPLLKKIFPEEDYKTLLVVTTILELNKLHSVKDFVDDQLKKQGKLSDEKPSQIRNIPKHSGNHKHGTHTRHKL